ncbi:MAG: hypothetical protein J7L15_04715 [Clostridiales bacterium]|nr:hypothetical protein [Clostridiales bacterium]
MEDLIQTAAEKKYTEFEVQAKAILQQKVATALQDKGYFDRLSNAQNEKTLDEKSGYKEFMTKKLKKFGVKSPAELEGSDKKKFFDEIDKEWEGDNEND